MKNVNYNTQVPWILLKYRNKVKEFYKTHFANALRVQNNL